MPSTFSQALLPPSEVKTPVTKCRKNKAQATDHARRYSWRFRRYRKEKKTASRSVLASRTRYVVVTWIGNVTLRTYHPYTRSRISENVRAPCGRVQLSFVGVTSYLTRVHPLRTTVASAAAHLWSAKGMPPGPSGQASICPRPGYQVPYVDGVTALVRSILASASAKINSFEII
jgi:hypothetical protein